MMKQKSGYENPKSFLWVVSKVWFADGPGIEYVSSFFPPWEVSCRELKGVFRFAFANQYMNLAAFTSFHYVCS